MNIDIITEKNLKEYSGEYTAFEVFPTNTTIPAGTTSDIKYEVNKWDSSTTFIKNSVVYHESSNTVYKCLIECKNIEPTISSNWQNYWQQHNGFDGQYYKYIVEVPANDTCNIRFYSYSRTRSECDVVVDWGDGTKSVVSDLNDDSITSFTNYEDTYGKEYLYSNFYVKHTYSSNNCGNKFIVKIYGKNYFFIRCGLHDTNSIVSRVLDRDLPIASCVTNLSSAFCYSKRLLQVIVPYGYKLDINNIGGLVGFCDNLRYFYMSSYSFTTQLISTSRVVQKCPNLECDISNFDGWFGRGMVSSDYKYNFQNCSKLYGKINDKVYWNNPQLVVYKDLISDGAFSGCSDEIKSQAPKTWGGTIT